MGCITFVPQTQGITEHYFADPDVDIDTPAFRKPSGFTRHAELMAFLEETVQGHEEWARLDVLGTSRQGREIPVVLLGRTSTVSEPLRVWFQGGLHGNEPASSEGLLLLLQRLLSDPEMASLLDRIQLAVVPVANPDGYQVQQRPAYGGLDLNRDQTKLQAPETRILKLGFHAFDPHVAVDFHEYRPYRRDFVRFQKQGITQAYDVMFLYSGNLNVPEPLREFTESAFVGPAKAAVESHGLRSHDYVTTRRIYGEIHFNQGSTNARASATSFALANTVSTLIEIRGVALGRTSFKRRVMSTYWVAESYLRTAVERADDVREVLARSAAMQEPVVVTSRRKVKAATLNAIDLATEELVELDVTVRDALESSPRLVRQRPFAYVLAPEAAEHAERLRILGLNVQELSEPRTLQVESYRITRVEREPMADEGTRRQSVQTEVEVRQIDFPSGSFMVRMDQPRANLAAEVLEPESSNGFVGYGVLKASKDDVLPIYRSMQPIEGH